MKITVGTSGTGGGFEKFCAGETDISDASRPIKDDEEAPVCKKNGHRLHARSRSPTTASPSSTNPDNDWVDCLTIEQLKKIWDQGSKVDNWNEVDPSFPDADAEAVRPGHRLRHVRLLHRRDQRRGGRQPQRLPAPREDDNVTVQGVEGDEGGLGYFGFSLLRAEQGQAQPRRGRRRRRLRRAERPRRSRTAPTRRSRARCSCTSKHEALQAARGQGVHPVRPRQRRRPSPRTRRSSR